MQKNRIAFENHRCTEDVIRQIDWLLGLDMTPEPIAGRMTLEGASNPLDGKVYTDYFYGDDGFI